MRRAIKETSRRRKIQKRYNEQHGITPKSIVRKVAEMLPRVAKEEAAISKQMKIDLKKIPKEEYGYLIRDLTSQMDLAAANLEFEKAAELRDLISEIKQKI
jgi:excinuclease ABC subunit B